MNGKTEDLISKVMEKAAVAVDYTAQKAGQVGEGTKLNFRLYELNGNIEEYERKIGKIVYAAHKGETAEQEQLDELLAKLDAAQADVLEIRHKIAERRKMKICPACGRACAADDQFCAGCGAEMQAAV